MFWFDKNETAPPSPNTDKKTVVTFAFALLCQKENERDCKCHRKAILFLFRRPHLDVKRKCVRKRAHWVIAFMRVGGRGWEKRNRDSVFARRLACGPQPWLGRDQFYAVCGQQTWAPDLWDVAGVSTGWILGAQRQDCQPAISDEVCVSSLPSVLLSWII